MTTRQTSGIEAAFVARLARLVERQDRAALAALRRGAGKRPGEAPEADRQFYALLPGDPPRFREDAFWLIATLFATHPSGRAATEGKPTDLGRTLRRVADKTRGGAGVERRLLAVLGAHRDDAPGHLRRLVALCRAAEVPVDWTQLLRDLQRWDHDERRVQRTWARSFWSGRNEEESHPVEHLDAERDTPEE